MPDNVPRGARERFELIDGIPCKIGTVPMVIFWRDRRTPLEVGRYIYIRRQRGARKEMVKVTRVDRNGYFMADSI
jgi:hypothetical protein